MTRKRKTTSASARQPKVKKSKGQEIVDVDLYTVEKIIRHRMDKLRFRFYVKWEGYSESENSEETLTRFINFYQMVQYFHDANLDSRDKDIVYLFVSLNQHGMRYLSYDDRFFIYNRQNSLLNSTMASDALAEFDDDISRMQGLTAYNEELRKFFNCNGQNLPQFTVVTSRDDLAKPPPLNRILYKSITNGMTVNPPSFESLLPSQRDNEEVFMPEMRRMQEEGDYVPVRNEGTTSQQENAYGEAQDTDYNNYMQHYQRSGPHDTVPPYREIVISREDSRWLLRSFCTIPKDTWIMSLCGKVVDSSAAAACLRKFGEIVAFNRFVALGNGKSLDRGSFYDFTKFISHSCDPNCEVKRVSEGVEHRLHLVSRRDIGEGDALTLDFFPQTTKKSTHKQVCVLQDKGLDIIQCVCQGAKCRRILYKEKVPNGLLEQTKAARLAEADTNFAGITFNEK